MDYRIRNFNAGPAALPLPVLAEIQAHLLNFKGTGMSILEISHRSKPFDEVIEDAVARVKTLLNVGDDYHVLFLQGGASTQFAMVPMNLLSPGDRADYVNTGTWSTKAIQEAKLLKKDIAVVATSEDRNFCYIPADIRPTPGALYMHVTSNNTIKGTQYAAFPETGGIPLVADMSSDMFSRPIDAKRFGLIYAGAQKNLGPAGVTLVVIREDFLKRSPKDLPTMLRYTTHADKNSMYNTPPCFAIYVMDLVLAWIMEHVGGLAEMERRNREKGDLLYGYMDASGGFYKPTADVGSRSLMNVTFRLPSEDLEKKFVEEATKAGLGGLKGHRSVGGCRASLYNAVDLAAVTELVDFMKEFAKKNG